MGQIKMKKKLEAGNNEVKEESVEGNGGNLYPETAQDNIEKWVESAPRKKQQEPLTKKLPKVASKPAKFGYQFVIPPLNIIKKIYIYIFSLF